ncbi:type II toxin-antitoxin system RelE/ParE family toxin [Ciceribacter sp. L1K22]|uniref:type II toxin-antitoxin system RelE/ParE family toxin n=1 Tax=Ciceribacter sp. L1K22 TaxID=2820275 RepID=UPI001ABE297C|nr:type II toxin-antitoxin system RelE/ParE family toxin [Ciceribacter sp. L1K22]MBO3759162.1 type II toxin-antitoxin system RelE/ParE family toxin [Ciceribacter sp. L1K22]
MAARYLFSVSAERDIASIVEHSLASFGDHQTDEYMMEFSRALDLLAANPDMGTPFNHDRSGTIYRRHRHKSHVIYYRKRRSDIFVLRVLHVKMHPDRHL